MVDLAGIEPSICALKGHRPKPLDDRSTVGHRGSSFTCIKFLYSLKRESSKHPILCWLNFTDHFGGLEAKPLYTLTLYEVG
jgi:hypothetical protein